MSTIHKLPLDIQRLLEAFGLEEEVSIKDENVYIEFPDFDFACEFRDTLSLQGDYIQRMITHPENGTPVIKIYDIVQ